MSFLRHLIRFCQLSLASHLRSTPLDLARRSRCKSCVRALEAHAVLWQGWVDHEQKLLMTLGSWDRRSARSASILISHDGSMVLYMDMVLHGSQEIPPVMLAFMLALIYQQHNQHHGSVMAILSLNAEHGALMLDPHGEDPHGEIQMARPGAGPETQHGSKPFRTGRLP